MDIWLSVLYAPHAKLICSSDLLFFREVDILKLLILANNYPAHFFAFISSYSQK